MGSAASARLLAVALADACAPNAELTVGRLGRLRRGTTACCAGGAATNAADAATAAERSVLPGDAAAKPAAGKHGSNRHKECSSDCTYEEDTEGTLPVVVDESATHAQQI